MSDTLKQSEEERNKMVTELVEKNNDILDATDLIKVTNNDEWKLHEETIAGKKASYIKMMRNKKMYVHLNQYIDGDFFLKLRMESCKKSHTLKVFLVSEGDAYQSAQH